MSNSGRRGSSDDISTGWHTGMTIQGHAGISVCAMPTQSNYTEISGNDGHDVFSLI